MLSVTATPIGKDEGKLEMNKRIKTPKIKVTSNLDDSLRQILSRSLGEGLILLCDNEQVSKELDDEHKCNVKYSQR